jgi:uncharacterized membrane protein
MTLEKIVATSCTHGESCPMYGTINVQKTISYVLMGILILVAIAFFFRKEPEAIIHKIVEKETVKEAKPINLDKLDSEEKKIVQLLQVHEGSMYQSDIIKETNWTKVRVTRLLDKLEGKKVIDRKRRGLANVVILQ